MRILRHVLLLGAVAFFAAAPALAQLTRDEAIQVLEREVLMTPETPAWSPYVDYGAGPGFEGLVPLNSTLSPWFTTIAPYFGSTSSADEAYVFLVDDDPEALWGHAVRYVVIDANQPFATATAFVSDQGWWMQLTVPGVLGGNLALTPDESVPAPSPTNGRGTATVSVDTLNNTLTLSGSYSGMTSDVTSAHIHGPAAPGGTAGVLVTLSTTGLLSGTMDGALDYGASPPGGLTTQQFEDLLVAGNAYVNVHTVDNASGEIRSQILLESDQVFFKERVSVAASGTTNSMGQVRGPITAPGPFSKPAFKADEEQDLLAAVKPFKGDPCAILFSGDNDNTFNDDVDRFKAQMEARGMSSPRLQTKKNGKLSDLAAMVAAACTLSTGCDKIYVYIGAHGGQNSLGFQGATAAERNVTEAELTATLCPLADKDAKLCFIVQACHSGSLTDSLTSKFPGASIFTSSSAALTSYGSTYYNKPSTMPAGRVCKRFSVFSNGFSNCWDDSTADTNTPKNGVDWEEAWTWLCTTPDTVYYHDDGKRWPKQRDPQHPATTNTGSIWVNSWTCEPGENLTIWVHGTAVPAGETVTWKIENGRSGLTAATPVGGTDNIDLDNVDPTERTVTPNSDGRFWDSVDVTCPLSVQSGDVAVYKVVLKVGGATVDVDYGCVSIVGADAVLPASRPAILPGPNSTEASETGEAFVQYTVVNLSENPVAFDFGMTMFNHYDSSIGGFLPPPPGIFVGDIGPGFMFGQLPPLGPFEAHEFFFPVLVDLDTPFSGMAVDLALWNPSLPEINANASVTVLSRLGFSNVPDAARVFHLRQNYPNPFNPMTTIRYSLEAPHNVKLNVYDVRGRLVRVLVNGTKGPGPHVALWDGRDDSGRNVASGTYVYRLHTGQLVESRKLTVVR